MATLLTDQADKVCGRGPLPTDLPCNSNLCKARGKPEEPVMRAAHKAAKRATQADERRMRCEAVRDCCNDAEWAVDNNDVGKLYKCIKQLGVRLKVEQLAGITGITPEASRKHFEQIGGSAPSPRLSLSFQSDDLAVKNWTVFQPLRNSKPRRKR